MSINITSIEIIKAKSEKVIARADVTFDWFILKGFKILRDNQTSKEYVTPPSYQAGPFWRPLFRTNTPGDWEILQRLILEQYNQKLMQEAVDEN